MEKDQYHYYYPSLDSNNMISNTTPTGTSTNRSNSSTSGCRNSSLRMMVLMVLIVLLSGVSSLPHKHHFNNQQQADFTAQLTDFEVVRPFKVAYDGGFLSNHLPHTHHRRRRSVGEDEDVHDLHYVIHLDGEPHQVSLRPNHNLVSPGAVVEQRRGPGGTRSEVTSIGILGCHYHGIVKGHSASRVALSACNTGLHGYIRTDFDEYLVEPVKDHSDHNSTENGHPHLVYRRSALPQEDSQDSCSSE
ncbi:unnamed protein product, partial [Meganyctiphanes norvegica]